MCISINIYVNIKLYYFSEYITKKNRCLQFENNILFFLISWIRIYFVSKYYTENYSRHIFILYYPLIINSIVIMFLASPVALVSMYI